MLTIYLTVSWNELFHECSLSPGRLSKDTTGFCSPSGTRDQGQESLPKQARTQTTASQNSSFCVRRLSGTTVFLMRWNSSLNAYYPTETLHSTKGNHMVSDTKPELWGGGTVALNREGLGNTFCKELVLMSAVPCLLLIHHVEMKSPSGVLEMLTTVPSHKKYSCGSVIM